MNDIHFMAARFHGAGKPLTLDETPLVGGDGVLVKVEAAGLCGTDLHIAVEGTFPTAFVPITLGHEMAGTVESGAGRFPKGERVCVYPHVPCFTCEYCRRGREALCRGSKIFGVHADGGFAQYVRAPESCLFRLPAGVPFEIGAALTDAVATAFHAVRRRAEVKPGERAAVFGCGALGTFAVKILKALGVSSVIGVDVSPHALERARKAGATAAINVRDEDAAKEIKKMTDGGVDAAFEFVGRSSSVREAVRSVRPGGRVVVVGIGPEPVELVPLRTFVGNEITVMGSMGLDRMDLEEVIRWASDGGLDLRGDIEVRPLGEINDVLREAASGDRRAAKFVLRPWPWE
ncbi:MAG: zinc-binding dehydrogenase [Nitrospirae bacterium]|nr:zinc-binding dehydrogenase [Nitrospirota bacterium]